MPMRNADKELTDTAQRVGRMAFYGEVAEIDSSQGRLRIRSGDILTGWLPFGAVRAGEDRTWSAPEPGEQVMVVCPNGDVNQGCVVCSLYREQHSAPADDINITRQVWKDGTVQEYDREKHRWTLKLNPSGTFRVEVGSSLFELTGDKLILKASRVDLAPKE